MWRERVSFGVVVLFLAATAYEVSVGLEWIAVGRDPGDDSPGQAIATIAALLAVAATLVLGLWRPVGRPSRSFR